MKGSSRRSSDRSRAARRHRCTCVRANPSTTGETLAALKVFHPPDRRDFRDEALYRDGEFIKPRRVRVAVEKKTKFGREVRGLWVDREWESLKRWRPRARPCRGRSRADRDASS